MIRLKLDGQPYAKPGRKPATPEERKTPTTIYITADQMKTASINGSILKARRLIYDALSQLQ